MSPPHPRIPRNAFFANALVAPLLFADVDVTIGVIALMVGIIALVLVLLAIVAVEVAGEHRANVRSRLHR
jgi:hypothetical protein